MQHYGSSIIVTNSINTTQSVYSSNINIHTAINTAANYKQMLHDTELMNVIDSDERLLRRVAKILLKDIGKVEGIEINPLNPKNISNTAVEELIPETLKSFLNHICSNRNGKDKKVLSIAKDIIARQLNGIKKMPKQVGLGISMKSATRSKEFIKYLNILGHCISYDTVFRIDTSWAIGIMNEGEGYSTIPSNIQPNIFTQAAFDNGDYGQENASQHATNKCCISTYRAVFRM